MLLVKKGFLKMTKKAPLGAIVGAVLFKAARREQLVKRKRKINQCIEKASDLCYPFFISLRL